MSWQDRAQRGLRVLADSDGDIATRTTTILNHILDESNSDLYISHDFFNIEQVTAGLPEGLTFDEFVAVVAGHVRNDLGGSNFGADVSDGEFRAAVLNFDDVIRRHIRFLNGVVHQAGVGQAHLALWDLILTARNDEASIYACYRDYLVGA